VVLGRAHSLTAEKEGARGRLDHTWAPRRASGRGGKGGAEERGKARRAFSWRDGLVDGDEELQTFQRDLMLVLNNL
jgi:hypothetical protein